MERTGCALQGGLASSLIPGFCNMPTDSRSVISRGSDSRWVSLRRGAFRWDLDPALIAWLDDEGELPISSWLEAGQAAIIKTGPHRTVYRLMLPSGIYYLKHYRTPDWQTVLQNLVRPCRADLEWQSAQKIAGLGLKTFKTEAVGRRRRLGVVRDNYLITREIADAEPLDRFVLKMFPALRPAEQQTARREIARQLGEIAAKLHLAGLLHRDLHPGNVLIQTLRAGLQLYLIDLHALGRKRRLSLAQIAGNLALLNNFFARLTGRSDRLRFLKAYAKIWNAGGRTPAFDRQAVRRVDRICQLELEKADRRGDLKWQRGNRRLIILEQAPNRCRGLAGLGREQLQSFQSAPESLFAEPRLIAWRKHDGLHRRATIELMQSGKPVRAIATAFVAPNLARTAWDMGHALLRRRLPAARPLLFVETPAGEADFLVLEQIPGATSLSDRLREHPDDGWMDEFLSRLAFELKRLHDYGFYQPSLGSRSILLREEAMGLSVWFVSLEDFQKRTRIESRQIIASLAHGFASWPSDHRLRSSQRLRFLRSYLGDRFAAEWKTFWRAISSEAERSAASREAA